MHPELGGDNPQCPQDRVWCTLSCPLLPWQVTCKAAITFFQYSVLANFYWLLVEGLYLQTLLLLTFTCDRSYTWGYILIGWGEPGDIPDIPAHPRAGTTWEWPDLRHTWPEVPSQRSPGLLPACPHPNISCMALVGTHLLLPGPRAAGEGWPDPGRVLPSSHTHPMGWEHPSQVPGLMSEHRKVARR